MERSIRSVLCLLLVAVASVSAPIASEATPVSLSVNRRASSVKFGVTSSSPTLTMNGLFRDFGGSLLLEPEHFDRSKVHLSLNLASAQLPPEQLLQALFIQTTLARFEDQSGTFTSTTIEPLGERRYLVTGTYSWMNRTRQVQLPVEVVRLSSTQSEVTFALDGQVHPKDVKPSISKMLPGISGSKGWAKAVLVFSPQS